MIETKEITGEISIGILDLRAFSGTTNKPGREQEKAGAQLVLEHLLGTKNFELAYTQHSKPFLKNSAAHISISHSHDKLVIILNRTRNTGVDIELVRDKVLNVGHKFLNEKEAAYAGQDVEKLITIWAAKEAMYKYYGLGQLEFKAHLFVGNFEDAVFFGKIEKEDFKKTLKLAREKIGNYVLVYILDDGGQA